MDAPYTLILKIVRATRDRDPSAVRQEYTFFFGSAERVGSAAFPWDDELLDELEEALGPRPARHRVQRLGEKLRTFLEEGLRQHQGWATYEKAILGAVEKGRPVHLTFRFDAAELYSLPWELVTLGTTDQHLGELRGCLIQYEWPGAGEVPLLPSSAPTPGRLLFGWSTAGGPVPGEEHLRALTGSAARGAYSFDATQDALTDLSLAALSRTLEEASRAGRPVNYLHLLCHGARDATGTPGLRWNAPERNAPPELIDAAALRQVLAPYKATLRLVVLCACHGGNTSPAGNVLGGVAQELHRLGIEAVVASRMPLSVKGSILLTESLHGALEGPGSIRPALLKAKSALTSTGGYDWASLQLYARAEDVPPETRPRPGRRKLAGALAATALVLLALGIGFFQRPEPQPVQSPVAETRPDVSPVLEEQPLAGQVFDEADQPVASATIIVSAGGNIVKTQTDEYGHFRLDVRAEKQLSVDFRVLKDGYEPYKDTATLGNTGLGFTLQRNRP